MYEAIVRILFSCLTTLRPASLKQNLQPKIVFMTCLSSLVKVGKKKGTQPRMRLE